MEKLKNILLLVAGCAVMGLAYALFLIPHHFVPGGVSGVAIIINYFAGLPVGALIMVLNVPIFLLGLKTMGQEVRRQQHRRHGPLFALIDLFDKVLKVRPATDNAILAAIYGGVMLGVGLGLIFRGRASTGGSDIIA